MLQINKYLLGKHTTLTKHKYNAHKNHQYIQTILYSFFPNTAYRSKISEKQNETYVHTNNKCLKNTNLNTS